MLAVIKFFRDACNKVSLCFGRVPAMDIFSVSDIRVSGRRHHHSMLSEGTSRQKGFFSQN